MSILSNVHMMSSLSRGGAAAVMEAAENGNPAVVMKNNKPFRVVVTVDDYEEMQEMEEDLLLMAEALVRLERSGPIVPAKTVYEDLGIDMNEIAEMDEVEIA